MTTKVFYGKPDGLKSDDLLNNFADKSVISSFKTSSVPLVAFWNHNEIEKRLKQLVEKIDLKLNSHNNLYFEYPTSPQDGKGKPSMTDLMICSGNDKIAIEAKVYRICKNEPQTCEHLA
jgi:hypothetical protein